MRRLLLIITLFYLPCKAQVVIAHRGASAYAPENTIPSFIEAIESGADYFELDVHQTKDTVLIVMHDRSVDRTTNGTGKISELDYAYIKSLNANVSGKFKELGVVSVPTLNEVLYLAYIHNRKVLIEIKHGSDVYPGIEQNIKNLISKYPKYQGVFIIHSFNKKALLKSDTGTAKQKLIVARLPLVSLTFDKKLSYDNFSDWSGVNVYYKFCSRRLVKKLHRMNKTIYAWTVNDPKAIERMVKRGVDGIITNKPGLAKTIVAKYDFNYNK